MLQKQLFSGLTFLIMVMGLQVAADASSLGFRPFPIRSAIFIDSSAPGPFLGTQQSPVRDIAQAMSLLNQSPQTYRQLRFKRGGSYPVSGWRWRQSGTTQEPFVIGAYGSGPRPRIQAGGDGFYIFNNPNLPVTTPVVEDLVLDGLELVGTHAVNSTGILFLGRVHRALVQDCLIRDFQTGLVLTGEAGNHHELTLNRNVVLDNYGLNGAHGGGLYSTHVEGLLLVENTFLANGYSMADPTRSPRNGFSHNIYISNEVSSVYLLLNLIGYGGSHGLQVRGPNALVGGNIIWGGAFGALFGNGNDPNPGGITGRVTHNVIGGLDNLSATHPGGEAIRIGNIANTSGSGAQSFWITDNIIVNPDPQAGLSDAIVFEREGTRSNVNGYYTGAHDTWIDNNVIVNYRRSLRVYATSSVGPLGFPGISNIIFSRNRIQQSGTEPLIVMADAASMPQFRSVQNTYYSAGTPQNARLQTALASTTYFHPLSVWLQATQDIGSVWQQPVIPNPNCDPGTYLASLSGPNSPLTFFAVAATQSAQNWDDRLRALPLLGYLRNCYGM